MFKRVAIIGLGLLGGSLGLALHKSGKVREITGYDLGKGVSERAAKVGAIDQPYDAMVDAVRGADLVILATPVGAMHALLQQLGPMLTPGTVVTDVASTKVQVISWAEEYLPASVDFIGGHPMSGKELSGVEAADKNLFAQHIYCLTPTRHTSAEAINKASELVEAVGGRLRFLDPAEHDALVASVSHLPFIASIALVESIAGSPGWLDASKLAASGFRDMSRLAAGSPEMYRDICLTNSEPLVRWLDEYMASLQDLRNRIANHDRTLGETFAEAQQLRQQWVLAQNVQEE